MDVDDLAGKMLTQAADEGQSARTVVSDGDAEALRERLRRLARVKKVGIRTARVDTAVVVVRVAAELWNQDAATMRSKLTPPP